MLMSLVKLSNKNPEIQLQILLRKTPYFWGAVAVILFQVAESESVGTPKNSKKNMEKTTTTWYSKQPVLDDFKSLHKKLINMRKLLFHHFHPLKFGCFGYNSIAPCPNVSHRWGPQRRYFVLELLALGDSMNPIKFPNGGAK